MKLKHFIALSALGVALPTLASSGETVSDDVIQQQRQSLQQNTDQKGFGPQAPRDLNNLTGSNPVRFGVAPPASNMNLCNIHFHKNAEHSGGEFTQYAGNGDGHGYHSGFRYAGQLSEAELAPISKQVCPSDHGGLEPGDTIEIHYVYSTAQVSPGATLGACLNESINNPQLRVEGQVFVVVNDDEALDFNDLTKVEQVNGYYQAVNIPTNTGKPIEYLGSTTGPTYNTQGSPFQVSWSVRPKVAKVSIDTVAKWCEGNEFDEDHAHGVRNLVTNPALLSSE